MGTVHLKPERGGGGGGDNLRLVMFGMVMSQILRHLGQLMRGFMLNVGP